MPTYSRCGALKILRFFTARSLHTTRKDCKNCHRGVINVAHNGETYRRKKNPSIQTHTGYPTHLLEFAKDFPQRHPTQKPVALLEYLIKTYTNEGDIVLDNCMGSGSTGVACVNTRRDFIGIELDDEYFHIAQERINSLPE